MRRTPGIICLLAPVVLGASVVVAGETAPIPEVIPLQKCSIEYKRATPVGVIQYTGRIQECLVRPGDRVKAGQVLGRLFNRDVLAELQSRTLDLENSEIAIHQREAALEVERAKLRRAEALRNRDARLVSIQDFQIQQLAVKTAELELQEAILKRRMAKSQVQLTEANLAMREITSPHDGIVVEIYKNVGESVMAGIPVYRVVDVDQLRVIGYLDAADAWRVRPGQTVRIVPDPDGNDLAIEHEVFAGKITFVDSEIDPKTRTCRIFAEVENRDGLLRSGLECRMEIDLRRVALAPSGPPAGGAAPSSDASGKAGRVRR